MVIVPAEVATSNTASTNVVDGIRASFSRVGAPPGLSFHLAGPLAVNVDALNTETGASPSSPSSSW